MTGTTTTEVTFERMVSGLHSRIVIINGNASGHLIYDSIRREYRISHRLGAVIRASEELKKMRSADVIDLQDAITEFLSTNQPKE